MRAAAGGDALLPPGVTRRLFAGFGARAQPGRAARPALAALTGCGREILQLAGSGLGVAVRRTGSRQ